MTTTAEERDEILQLLYRYNHAIDGGDAEGWAETWAPDGVFEGVLPDGAVLKGREQLVEFAANVRGMRHVVANPVIDVQGDEARVQAYVFVIAGSTIPVVGLYDDTLVRTEDGWRFSCRRFSIEPAES